MLSRPIVRSFTRREVLKGMATCAGGLSCRAPLCGSTSARVCQSAHELGHWACPLPIFACRPLSGQVAPSDIIALVTPGSDRYITEKYADEIGSALNKWSDALRKSPSGLSPSPNRSTSRSKLPRSFQLPNAILRSAVRNRDDQRVSSSPIWHGAATALSIFTTWLASPVQIETAEFEIFSMEQIAGAPLTVRAEIRYDLDLDLNGARKEERVGSWLTEWFREDSGDMESTQVGGEGRVGRFCDRLGVC